MSTSTISPDDDLRAALGRAISGLLYTSESDEPFEAFLWKSAEADAVRQIASMGKKTTPMTETSVEDFFVELVAGDQGPQFRALRDLLQSRLSGVRALRIGEVEVGIYLIGKTPAGNWAGVHTRSVET